MLLPWMIRTFSTPPGRCLICHQRARGPDRSSYDRPRLTIQHRRLNRICPLISETSEVYGPRPAKERRRLCVFEGVLQLDTKFAKVPHVPGDHRESVNDGRRGDHAVLGDSVRLPVHEPCPLPEGGRIHG